MGQPVRLSALSRQPRPTLLLAVLLAFILLITPAPTAAQQDNPTPAGTDSTAVISDRLAAALARAQEPISFLVVLKEQVDAGAVAAQAAAAPVSSADAALDMAAVRSALYARLTQHAITSQAPLRGWLDAHGIPYRAFYIVNMIEVTGDAALAATLAARPDVARLAGNNAAFAALEQTPVSRPALHGWTIVAADEADATAALPWGLVETNADDVWALGFKGAGVVIASQDTGVDWKHEALRDRYRGWNAGGASHTYNWHDAFGLDAYGPCSLSARAGVQEPCDDHGHGTHTVGTLTGDGTAVGKGILGMAPAATWIGCRNMLAGAGTPASYTACFEFFLAPYPQGGNPQTDGRPELAPDIINNSWGCPPSEGCDDPNILRQVVETSRAAGQMVVASAGNFGPGCSTVVDPIGIYDASFTVGAYAEGGALAYFSSRGPVSIDDSGRLKPDLVAPGVDVYSTGPNQGYFSNSGTSMAAPHVAGAAALLWSAVPALKGNVALSEQILLQTATPVASDVCASDGSTSTVNNLFGHGQLNVLAAVQLAQNPPTVRIRATVNGAVPSIFARLRVHEPWSATPRWVRLDSAGEAVLPVYTLDWTGEYPTVLTVTLPQGPAPALRDNLGRILLQVELFEAEAIFPIAAR